MHILFKSFIVWQLSFVYYGNMSHLIRTFDTCQCHIGISSDFFNRLIESAYLSFSSLNCILWSAVTTDAIKIDTQIYKALIDHVQYIVKVYIRAHIVGAEIHVVHPLPQHRFFHVTSLSMRAPTPACISHIPIYIHRHTYTFMKCCVVMSTDGGDPKKKVIQYTSDCLSTNSSKLVSIFRIFQHAFSS